MGPLVRKPSIFFKRLVQYPPVILPLVMALFVPTSSTLADHRGTTFAEGTAEMEIVRCGALQDQAKRITGASPPYPPQGTVLAIADCDARRYTITVNVPAPIEISEDEISARRNLNKATACFAEAMWLEALDHGWNIRFELRFKDDLIGEAFEITGLEDCGDAAVALAVRLFGPIGQPERQVVPHPPPPEAEQKELEQLIAAALSSEGFARLDRVTVSTCTIAIAVNYDRPCGLPEHADLVTRSVENIDMTELSYYTDLFGPRIIGDGDLVTWDFTPDMRRRISEIEAGAEAARKQAQSSLAPDRLRPLSDRYGELFEEFAVNSRETTFYCSGETLAAPQSVGVAIRVKPDQAQELVAAITGYGQRYCAQ